MKGSNTLNIRLLADIEVARGDERVALPQSKKTRALLAYLVVTGRRQRRERLCSLLWDVTDDPRAALRWSLSKLRNLVDDSDRPRVLADRESVAFDLAGVDVDLLDLRDRLSEGVGAVPTEELEEVAARFRGESLEGLELPDFQDFQAWCSAEREETRTTRVKVLRELVARTSPKPERAIPYARDLVQIDPDDETARSTLSELLSMSRDSDRTEQQYQSGLSLFKHLETRKGTERPSTPLTQEIRFCTASDGVRIAYATTGRGPTLLKAANWMNHLEFDWDSPVWRHMVEGLARDHRLIRYDQRGNGLSDWDVEDLSFEAHVGDLETVVEATGLDRFALLGISQGCAFSIGYAVRHPERVTHLILHGGYTRGWGKRSPEEAQRRKALGILIEQGWGQDNPAFRQVFTSLFVPDATEEQMRWFNDLQRVSTSPGIALRLQKAAARYDVRSMLKQVKVPTLVTHSRNESVVPFKEGRELATSIPGARFVPLESRNHLILEQEPAWTRFLGEVRGFLENERPGE